MKEKDTTQEQKTIELLQTLKETPLRDPNKTARGRQAFLAQAKEISSQPVSVPVVQRLINVFNRPKLRMRFSTLTIGIIFGALLLTFSSSAYAARQSKPDQILYPFKLWLEESKLSLTQKPDKQIELHLVFAEERLKELSAEGKLYTASEKDQAVGNFSNHIEALRSMLAEEQDHNPQNDRLEAIIDQYKQFDEEEQETRPLEQDELQDEDATDPEKDPAENQEDKSKDPDQSEDQEDPKDNGGTSESKHEDDGQNASHLQKTAEPASDDKDHEEGIGSTDEPDSEPTDDSDSSDAEPTKTPEPND